MSKWVAHPGSRMLRLLVRATVVAGGAMAGTVVAWLLGGGSAAAEEHPSAPDTESALVDSAPSASETTLTEPAPDGDSSTLLGLAGTDSTAERSGGPEALDGLTTLLRQTEPVAALDAVVPLDDLLGAEQVDRDSAPQSGALLQDQLHQLAGVLHLDGDRQLLPVGNVLRPEELLPVDLGLGGLVRPDGLPSSPVGPDVDQPVASLDDLVPELPVEPAAPGDATSVPTGGRTGGRAALPEEGPAWPQDETDLPVGQPVFLPHSGGARGDVSSPSAGDLLAVHAALAAPRLPDHVDIGRGEEQADLVGRATQPGITPD
ncbi:MAG TPA: hypothetical protein VIL00_13465 [Pseudonocardiaceae bacterium]